MFTSPVGSFVIENCVCVHVCFSQVSIEEGDAKAKEFGVMFIETSSKAGFNIKVRPMHCLSRFFFFGGSWDLCAYELIFLGSQ